MSHQVNKSILIVCEGEGTEPSYFSSIRDLLINKNLKVAITISPLPKEEQEIVHEVRVGGKRRQLKEVEPSKEEDLRKFSIEDEFKAQPIRYVREAQIGLESGAFDEVWAVFDKDGHPKQKEAFELAQRIINDNIVNIGFSSISFEHWILLHFENNYTAFHKSKCRNGDEVFDCGNDIHENDCKGKSCVCGYMVSKELLPNNCKDKLFLISDLPAPSIAFKNAVELRKCYTSGPIYLLNPYTDVDKLVFSLIHMPKCYTWKNNTGKVLIGNITYEIHRLKDKVKITIENLNPLQRFILNEHVFQLIDANGEAFSFGERKIIDKEETLNLNLIDIGTFDPLYISCKISENQFFICDF
ncbi:MAG: hypothetical protein C0448_10525 [Sphingobacteriaceae bacterium]|nr:hypothetical protein [Sphingobacteriaceae bacterium]